MAPDKSYVTRDDGMFRSFDRACKRAIDSGDHKNDGPTTTQLAGALMGRPGFNEEKLGKNWKIFAATYPTHATIIRRGAAELRASANEPLKPDLPAGARTATKYLLISNPDYKEGLTLASKNGTETASKVNATRSMKRKADSLDIPDPLPSFMPKHKQRVSKKATLDADEDGKAAVEDVDLDKSELANGETSIDTVL